MSDGLESGEGTREKVVGCGWDELGKRWEFGLFAWKPM